jgi:hypothetical protein
MIFSSKVIQIVKFSYIFMKNLEKLKTLLRSSMVFSLLFFMILLYIVGLFQRLEPTLVICDGVQNMEVAS